MVPNIKRGKARVMVVDVVEEQSVGGFYKQIVCERRGRQARISLRPGSRFDTSKMARTVCEVCGLSPTDGSLTREELYGKEFIATVKHKEVDGITYANITKVEPLDPSAPVVEEGQDEPDEFDEKPDYSHLWWMKD